MRLLMLTALAWTAVHRGHSVLIGAIRWDDWYNTSSNPNDSGQAILRAMSKAPWQARSPFFCTLSNSTANATVTCDNNQQAVVDAEIEYAVAAGIHYWAFDVYPMDTDLAVPLQLFMSSSSPSKASLRFCHLLQTGWMSQGGLPAWPAKIALYVSQMSRSDYQLVDGHRPLVYVFDVYEDAWGTGTGWDAWIVALEMYGNATVAAGLGWPYIVLQDFSPVDGNNIMTAVNAGRALDALLVTALSSYAVAEGASAAGSPFDVLVASSVSFWATCAAQPAARGVVPVVTMGWDPRPMNETHLPWQNYTNPAFFVMPTMAQVTSFVALALNWTLSHANVTPAGILLSAWNEFAEGHYIGPNLPQYGGDERLQAIAAALGAGHA